MADMLGIGISGLSAAQVALNTVGNNISNTNTPGYSRQVVQQTEQVSQGNGRYTIGSGVNVVAVYPIAPLASGPALAIGMSRYRDAVHIGFYADGAAMPDMEKLTEALPAALAELDV